jgi:1-deoxy-D-xylulose-5-phosphate reductoisomerase
MQTFSPLRLAFECIDKGGALPAVLNAANEICVAAFLSERLSFCGIMDTLEQVVADMQYAANMHTMDEILACDREARRLAMHYLEKQ